MNPTNPTSSTIQKSRESPPTALPPQIPGLPRNIINLLNNTQSLIVVLAKIEVLTNLQHSNSQLLDTLSTNVQSRLDIGNIQESQDDVRRLRDDIGQLRDFSMKMKNQNEKLSGFLEEFKRLQVDNEERIKGL